MLSIRRKRSISLTVTKARSSVTTRKAATTSQNVSSAVCSTSPTSAKSHGTPLRLTPTVKDPSSQLQRTQSVPHGRSAHKDSSVQQQAKKPRPELLDKLQYEILQRDMISTLVMDRNYNTYMTISEMYLIV